MGTNFYCREKITKEHRDKAKKIQNLLNEHIDKGDLNSIKDDVNNLLEIFSKEVHLGKRSCGWQFLWDYHNGRYFNPTLDSIKEYLKDKDIYNEYGEYFTLEQFLDDEIKNFLYEDKYHDSGKNGEYSKEYLFNDNLRFSLFEDFS